MLYEALIVSSTHIRLEPCVNLISAAAAAFQVFRVGGAPTSSNRCQQRHDKIGGGGVGGIFREVVGFNYAFARLSIFHKLPLILSLIKLEEITILDF